MSLSFTIIIILLPNVAALLSPSRASPPVREPSPIIAIIFSFPPVRSLPLARPVAKLTEVDV